MTGVYKDKHWVVYQIQKALANDNELLDYFDWLLKVWNTDRDYEYPSLKSYDPADDDDEEEETSGEPVRCDDPACGWEGKESQTHGVLFMQCPECDGPASRI